jgi:hypothetical protein
MKGHDLQDTWFQNLDGVPRDVLFGVSPNGWTDNSKALAWLERSFGPGSETEKKAAGQWRMLIFDGHISHVNREFLSTCLDYKVLPLCLPPHTTHFSQPLDVSLFAPLKSAYSNILRRHTEAGERGVWKGNFYKFLIEAEKIAFTPENIRSGFWWTGLVPLDFDVVRRRLDIPNPTFNSTALVAPLPPSSPIRPLSSLTPAEVYAISTPYDHRTFHQLRGSLALDLQGNSPRSSRLKHAFDKISNAHISKLHHCDDLEERLETETKRKAASGQQKPQKRRRIPDEVGLSLRWQT